MQWKQALVKNDKAWHFLACYFIASIWWPMAIAVGIGIEVLDWFDYGKDTKGFWKMALGDLLADGLGVLLAFFIGGYNG